MSLSLALTIINLLASMHTTEGQDFPKGSEEKMWGVESGKKYYYSKKYVIVLLRKKKRDKVLYQSKKRIQLLCL